MWEQCSHKECEVWVKIGIKSCIPLSILGHFTNIEAHVGSKVCGSTSNSLKMVAQNSCIVLATFFPQSSQPSSVRKTTLAKIENDTSTCVFSPAHACALLLCPRILLNEMNWLASQAYLSKPTSHGYLTFKLELFNDALAVCSVDCDACAACAGQNSVPCVTCDSLLPKVQASIHKSHTCKNLLTPLQLIENSLNLIGQVNYFKLQVDT
ncbi:hypothetical protein PAXRUDRAFT_34267 [Paxillus rubicundulus Ve08.2h10]|uniref:Uncharacterized protein n=1 Tax=Paxillus rubicundulus Ve08.2h10 TaxID=930991 RepID=A0A0D0DMV6_9AGAM|nr:hypothetical protein PAXRUDRAFT_34267 [Paxillus rubicundulus Ve08.2h10]